ncbi:glycosyltransferase family 4 protein [Rathayibacter tanaceti]|uniref:GalNAc-alpha-(1->4)-GalNAc-alpha-(1->3)-diNAcBac-PP-undecaprenol alpha-1,4-N-acetyl-D-galactosaminyltransferase n=2 Tax=Rathayibacter tanaceti TaxID=1671680 RepID=A0A162GJ71_9MICO|nr:glycosyltransferase family 4 protein [Rathayibacter tanaceti]KZX22069.1 GalNAc-alpha-(1->4)-GalNAc-alpha-(1->3)-diNAcBac-PP-undecaprenol alpha-1,4-N-acetyl-D-galactosaminyltransferase [Rathayibacter tanaceti]QHC56582.1 glycosyltransferase [Rathayibacter tanaceti]TCO36803.1 glycosyltransferase involved in cell wall biosynthesis [Rathayibacter tanaceti]
MTPARSIFAVGRGQYENIGDIILRRQLLDWLRDCGPLHVYVGHSPWGYDDGLRLGPDDVVYRSLVRWYAALAREAIAGRAHSVFKPGEIQLTLIGMKEHLVMLPGIALVRLGGGRVVRAGVGARNFAPLPRAIMWPSMALSNYTRWRDDRTAAYMRVGAAMPDLGYGEGASDDELRAFAAQPDEERRVLVLSLREDHEVDARPYPEEEWLAAVKGYAEREALDIVVVTQVAVDAERSRRLAADLDADILDWDPAHTHDQHEILLRELYRRTRLALSDRLHVIIMAFTEGAAPVSLQMDASTKSSRHFETIGIHGVTVDMSRTEPERGIETITAVAARRSDLLEKLLVARGRLRGVRDDIQALLAVPARSTPTGTTTRVHHVGRSGEVPGGMTQVVNGYLRWPFDRSDVRVIPSRSAPGEHVTAARLAAAAAARIVALSRRDPGSVIVVHLSERGSFLREGSLLRLAHRLGLRTVAHLHGSEFAAFTAAHPRLVAGVLRSADEIITLSEQTSVICRRIVPAERVHLVPNALERGTPREKTRTVVFGGVVSHRKGVDVLQKAWAKVEGAEGWRLLIAGPIREPEVVDRSVPGIEFLGSLENARLLQLLDEAAVAVLPSRDEAMPIFILEALARDAAVVSTAVGGIPEVLGEGCGRVVAPGDVDALAAALTELITDEDARAAVVAKAGARFRERFSADAVFPRIEEVWLGTPAA